MTPQDGDWADDDLRRAFVSGAKWWEYRQSGATMFASDQRRAEDEAERRFPGGKVRKRTVDAE